MAGNFMDTFKPVNVAAEKDELGNTVDNVAESVEALPVAEPAAPVEEEPKKAPIADTVVKEDTTGTLSGFTPIEEPVSIEDDRVVDEEDDPGFYNETGTQMISAFGEAAARQEKKKQKIDTEFEELHAEYVKTLLPDGTEPGSYSENDIVKDDKMFNIVYDYMDTRYGLQAVEGISREKLVGNFLDARRGEYLGNSIRVLSDYDYLNDKKEDGDTLDKIGAGYVLYENMAGILSKEVSMSEKGGAVYDTLWYLLADPINAVGGVVGRIAGGTATKVGIKSLDHYVMKEVTKRRLAGETVEATGKIATDIMRVAATKAKKEGTEAVAQFAVKMQAPAWKRVLSSAGVREIAATTATDAVIASGLEFVYQKNMITAGVQDEINPVSVGLAALLGLSMGAVATVRVAKRGASGTALPSEVVKRGTHADAAKSLQESMKEYFKSLGKDMDGNSSWAAKVGSGKELDVKDTNFFIDLLLGVDPVIKADGTVDKPGLKGIAQVMQEQGFFFEPRDGDDKLTNWISDFLSEFDDGDMKNIVKGFEDSAGVKLTGLGDDITSKSFSNDFAKKISQSAQSMNAVSQAANRLNIEVADLNVEQYINSALGQNLLAPNSKTVSQSSRYMDKWGRYFPSVKKVSEGQNQFIRALVSHPSTSMLNLVGYAASSSLGSASDLLRASFMMTGGSVKRALGMKEAGVEMERIADALIGANMNRAKLILDPDMTATAYLSAIQKNSGALEALNRVQAGGIDTTKTINDVLGQGPAGKAIDTGVDMMQNITFVRSQDILTKSQEYVFQMDKNLRITFGKTWSEFYTSPDANKLMATKEFRALEEAAVAKTLEHTFGKSYKGSGPLGEVASIIEDARNIPGLGLMVPFGRFFNNTIDFASKNSPVGLASKLVFDKYPDKTMAELVTNNMVAGGLIYSMMQGEDEARKQGLGLYDTITSEGDVKSMQYDYPLSLFKASARFFSYLEAGEPVPIEIIEQIGTDFFGGGLTRNLEQTGSVLVDTIKATLQGEWELAKSSGKDAVGGVGAQLIGGFTRFYEPGDAIVGIAFNKNMAPKNIKDGNAFLGKAFMYMDTTIDVFTGRDGPDVSVSSSEGERKQQTTKNVGARRVQLTNTLRVMNMLGLESWDNNASFKVSKLAAEAGNEYNRSFFNRIDEIAGRMMESEQFRDLPVKEQRGLWEKNLAELRRKSRQDLALNYAGEQSTLSKQYELTQDHTIAEIKNGLAAIDFGGKSMGDLNAVELDLLQSHFRTQNLNEALDSPVGTY
tara:strand:- start:122 stop:3910 length:3789 start_codon:yes stop_codon:yes gene_type:complete